MPVNQRDYLSSRGLGYYNEPEDARRSNLLQRADQLQDMFGKKPMDFKEFTEKSGGSGFWENKFVGAASAVALGLSFMWWPALVVTVPAAIYASRRAWARDRNNMDHYSEYLNNFANEARQSFVQQIQSGIPGPEQNAGPQKSFVAAYEKEQLEKALAQAQGATRQ
jgi:hypothetical protein